MANPEEIILKVLDKEWAEVANKKFREGTKKYIALLTGFDEKHEFKREFIPRSDDKNAYRVEYFTEGEFYEVVSTYYTSKGQPRALIRGYYKCTKANDSEIVLTHVGKRAVKQAFTKSVEGKLFKLKKQIEEINKKLEELAKTPPEVLNQATDALNKVTELIEVTTLIHSKVVPELKATAKKNKELTHKLKDELRDLAQILTEYLGNEESKVIVALSSEEKYYIKKEGGTYKLIRHKYSDKIALSWDEQFKEIEWDHQELSRFIKDITTTSYYELPRINELNREFKERGEELKQKIRRILELRDNISKTVEEFLTIWGDDKYSGKYFSASATKKEIQVTPSTERWEFLNELTPLDMEKVSRNIQLEITYLETAIQEINKTLNEFEAKKQHLTELAQQFDDLKPIFEDILKTLVHHFGDRTYKSYYGYHLNIHMSEEIRVEITDSWRRATLDLHSMHPKEAEVLLETLQSELARLAEAISNLNTIDNKLTELSKNLTDLSSKVATTNKALAPLIPRIAELGYPFSECCGEVRRYSTTFWKNNSIVIEAIEDLSWILKDATDRTKQLITTLESLTIDTEPLTALQELHRKKLKELFNFLNEARKVLGNPIKAGSYIIYFDENEIYEITYHRCCKPEITLYRRGTKNLPARHIPEIYKEVQNELKKAQELLEGGL